MSFASPGPRYGSPFYFDVGTVLADHINRMLKGEKSPKEAVTGRSNPSVSSGGASPSKTG